MSCSSRSLFALSAHETQSNPLIIRRRDRQLPQRVSLHERSYQSWLLQLQTWAADRRFLSAGVDALRLKPDQAKDQLNRIANRLANRDKEGLPSLEALRSHYVPAKD